MPALRLEIACGGRAEIHVIDDAEVSVGGDATSELILDHPSVEPEHARIALRRGRILVIPSPRAHRSVRIGSQVVRAPSVLPPGRRAWVGEVSIAVAPATNVLPVIAPAGIRLGLERPARDGLRRFDAIAATGESAELAVASASPADEAAWLERVARSASAEPAARVLAHAALGASSPWALERLGSGVRLRSALDVVARGAVQLPPEASVVIISGVALALAALHSTWGPLGALDGELVHLGHDGAIRLVRPGPALDPWQDRRRWLAPERRRGGVPTRAADIWALGALARHLGLARHSPVVRRLAAADPEFRPTDLVEIAGRIRAEALAAGLDASTRHVGQLVDLVSPPARPLGRLQLRSAFLSDSAPSGS